MKIPKRKKREYFLTYWKKLKGDKERYSDYLKRNAIKLLKYNKGLRIQKVLKNTKERRKKCGFFPAKNWGKEEEFYLKENYKIESYDKMAEKLGRGLNSVEHKLRRLKLFKYNRYHILK